MQKYSDFLEHYNSNKSNNTLYAVSTKTKIPLINLDYFLDIA